ncbi:hypothetical protein MWU59_11975 [Flavobacteriaceae bacterium F08102]|nr:hypothetical protein [Flavobacteriaceae bacterium F08102]
MNKLDQKCRDLRGAFDTEEPSTGHFERFSKKLNQFNEQLNSNIKQSNQSVVHWKWLSVAASILLVVGLYMVFQQTGEVQEYGYELADVSPEMEETQSFFTMTIQHELSRIQAKRTVENETVIDDALAQLTSLEKNYNSLKVALADSDYDRRIILAMITNFQQRIAVLHELLEQLDEIETLKTTSYENKIM